MRPCGFASLITTAVSRTLVAREAEGEGERGDWSQPIEVSLYFNT